MKKKFALLLLVVTSCVLYADSSEAPTQKEKELQKTMQSFSKGLELIQYGIIYNDKIKMESGVRKLKMGEKDFLERHGETLKKYMPKQPDMAMQLATSSYTRMNKYIMQMHEGINSVHDYSTVAADYSHILQECVGCHQKIRKW